MFELSKSAQRRKEKEERDLKSSVTYDIEWLYSLPQSHCRDKLIAEVSQRYARYEKEEQQRQEWTSQYLEIGNLRSCVRQVEQFAKDLREVPDKNFTGSGIADKLDLILETLSEKDE